MARLFSGTLLILLMFGVLTLVSTVQPVSSSPATIVVPDDFPTIQNAIDYASIGDKIYVRAGTYQGNILVNKPLSLIGENAASTIIDGGGTDSGTACISINADNTDVTGFTLQNSHWMQAGIWLYASHCNITRNNFINNWRAGVMLATMGSHGNIIAENSMTNNGYCVRLGASCDNTIVANNMMSSAVGVSIWAGSGNLVIKNNVKNNGYGIELISTYGNIVYHNNIENNAYQVQLEATLVNVWDNSYPSGGNYWSDYTGLDSKKGSNQNQPGSDGIGDIPYTIDLNNIDHYPLMSPSSVSPTPTDKSAIIIDPMYLEHQNRPFIYDVASYLTSAGYSCSWKPGSAVTVDWLKTGLRQGVILWRSHAIYDPSEFGVALNTGQLFDPQDIDKYRSSGDYPRRIIPTNPDGNGNRYWAITPQFILDYYGIQNRLPNSLVYVEACESIRDSAMAKAFVDSGAGAYVGYKDRIYFNNIFGVPFADNDAAWGMYDFCIRGFNVQEVVDHKILGGFEKSYYGDKNLRLRTDIASAKTLSVSAYCPVDLLVTDPQGRRVGIDPVSHIYVNEIPGAIYMGPNLETEFVWIPFTVEGEYDVTLIGTGTGSYNLKIEQEILPSTVVSQDYSGTITVNERHYYSVMLREIGEMTTVSWEYFFEDVKRDTILKISTDDQYFQFVAPGKDFGVKYDSKMLVRCDLVVICYGDRQMRLTATAVDGRFGFCTAIAYDKQTRRTYVLTDWLSHHIVNSLC